MPQYLSPGVYIEELVGPHPIQGVSTSITGMVGVTLRGPVAGKPKLVTNFNDYQIAFGGFLPPPSDLAVSSWGDKKNLEGGAWWLFPQAVKAFFDCGGEQLYVKRVFAANGASPAAASFTGGLFADVARSAPQGATSVAVSHLVGISQGTPVTILYRDPAAPASQATTVDTYAYGATSCTITLANGLQQQLRAGRDLVQIKAPDAGTTLTVTASAPGTWGKGISVRAVPAVTNLGLLADPAQGAPFATVVAAGGAVKDSPTVNVTPVPGLDAVTPALPFWVQLGADVFPVNAAPVLSADGKTLTLTLAPAAGAAAVTHDPWPAGTAVRRVRLANAVASPMLRVAGAGRLYADAIVELDDGRNKQTLQVAAVQGDIVTFTSNATAGYFEGAQLHLVELQLTDSYDDGTSPVTETYSTLRLGDQDPLGPAPRINGQSQLITVSQAMTLVNAHDLRLPVGPTGPAIGLDGGDDAYGSLSVEDFVGVDGGSGHRTGIQAMEDIDEIAICAVPGMWSQTVQAGLIDHCALLKDRFAILDPPDGLDIDGIGNFRQYLDTEYAALYYPWCVTMDLRPGAAPGSNVNVPPSGFMAGIYASNDNSRGVHKAPANVQISGINLSRGLAADITKREQDILNPAGINALRFFPGRGQRVWGARTLSDDTDWKYINVRRLFLFVEKSIFVNTQWVVFEPNNEQLWALIRQTISAFLTTVWQTGALAGKTPAEAFLVQCDRTTMTQDDLDNGRLICIVGLAPVFPAEFVIFRFEQQTAGSQPQS